MPQLDLNAFLPIFYWLFISFNCFFIVVYIFYYLPILNSFKIYKCYRIYIYAKLLALTDLLKN